jgi:hypothetical protein|tara:strand:+ start:308 stop:508 length:201 start_codon:yes stop_codon:yes gene_type:complete
MAYAPYASVFAVRRSSGVIGVDIDTIRTGLDEYRDSGCNEIVLNILGPSSSTEAAWELAASMGGEF